MRNEEVERLILNRERLRGYTAAHNGEPFNPYAGPNWQAGYLSYHQMVMASDGYTLLGDHTLNKRVREPP
jgi:hypothetical protein